MSGIPVTKQKILRVIFKDYDLDILSRPELSLVQKLAVFWGRTLTIPFWHDGFAYDHCEIITPQKERFSIRMESTEKKAGVFLIPKDGLNNIKNKEIIVSQGFRSDPTRYKLFFGFAITDEEEKQMYEFIDKHKGQPYNFTLSSLNFIAKSIGLKFLVHNSFLKDTPPQWDCVSLIARLLNHIGILKITDDELLGMSALNFANYMIDRAKEQYWGTWQTGKLKILVSKELCPSSFDTNVLKEHAKGTKRSRKFSDTILQNQKNVDESKVGLISGQIKK